MLDAIRRELDAEDAEDMALDFAAEGELVRNAATLEETPCADGEDAVARAVRAVTEAGVARINGVFSQRDVAAMSASVLSRREAADAAVGARRASHAALFGGDDDGAIARRRRCDLKLPLARNAALARALSAPSALGGGGDGVAPSSVLRGALEALVGDHAPLFDLSCIISTPGAERQGLHADVAFDPEHADKADGEPSGDDVQRISGGAPLYTVLIALQDVETAMGPTLFVPSSHVFEPRAHAAMLSESSGARRGAALAELCARRGVRAATLRAGDCVVYDPRVVHGGGANDADHGATRSLLALTFVNARAPPSADAPHPTHAGGFMAESGDVITLGRMAAELTAAAATEDAKSDHGFTRACAFDLAFAGSCALL